MNQQSKPYSFLILIALVVLAALLFSGVLFPSDRALSLQYSDVLDLFENEQVESFVLDGDTLRLQLMHSIGEKFDGLSISSSVSCNVEINDAHANKGEAIAALAAYLDLPMAQTMAIGDGLNDRSMIRMTGVGVAMRNACPELLVLADEVTAGCDEDGAAIAIERHCVPGKANHG